MFDPNQLGGLALAYLGDSIFEIYIRKYILEKGYTKVNKAHKYTVMYTSGVSQAEFVRYLIENDLLTEEEIAIYKRGRNSHIGSVRKNISLADYGDATGFEAIIGYLGFNNNYQRIEEIINIVLKLKEV